MRTDYSRHLLFAALVAAMLLPCSVIAQDLPNQLTDFNRQRIELNSRAMKVLSGWALINIAAGSVGYASSSGSTKYFHQMNAAWNIVNLAIAGGALYQYGQADPAAFTFAESLSEARNMENILLLNIGLNVSYIAAGGFLWERGLRKTSNRLRGYGQSLIVQGGFLLLFDSVLYVLNRSHNRQLHSLLENVSIEGTAISLSIPL